MALCWLAARPLFRGGRAPAEIDVVPFTGRARAPPSPCRFARVGGTMAHGAQLSMRSGRLHVCCLRRLPYRTGAAAWGMAVLLWMAIVEWGNMWRSAWLCLRARASDCRQRSGRGRSGALAGWWIGAMENPNVFLEAFPPMWGDAPREMDPAQFYRYLAVGRPTRSGNGAGAVANLRRAFFAQQFRPPDGQN